MNWKHVGLRRVSEVEGRIPWKDPLVGLIRLRASGEDCEIAHARTVGEKRAMADDMLPSDCLIVAWPGQHSQDMFLLDTTTELRAVMSAPPRRKR